jgi:hypothetical protein
MVVWADGLISEKLLQFSARFYPMTYRRAGFSFAKLRQRVQWRERRLEGKGGDCREMSYGTVIYCGRLSIVGTSGPFCLNVRFL